MSERVLSWLNYGGSTSTVARLIIPVENGSNGYGVGWEFTKPLKEVSVVNMVRVKIPSGKKIYSRPNPNPGGYGYNHLMLYVKGRKIHLGAWADVANNRIWVARDDDKIFDIITDNITEWCLSSNPNLCANFGPVLYVPDSDVFIAGGDCGGHIMRIFKLEWDGSKWNYTRLKRLPLIVNTYRGHVIPLATASRDSIIVAGRWGDPGTPGNYWKIYKCKIDDILNADDGTQLVNICEKVVDLSGYNLGGPCHHLYAIPLINGGALAIFREEKKVLFFDKSFNIEDVTPENVKDLLAVDGYRLLVWYDGSSWLANTPEGLIENEPAIKANGEPDSDYVPVWNGKHAIPVIENGKLFLEQFDGTKVNGKVIVIWSRAIGGHNLGAKALGGAWALDSGYVSFIDVPIDGVELSGPAPGATIIIDPFTLG